MANSGSIVMYESLIQLKPTHGRSWVHYASELQCEKEIFGINKLITELISRTET